MGPAAVWPCAVQPAGGGQRRGATAPATSSAPASATGRAAGLPGSTHSRLSERRRRHARPHVRTHSHAGAQASWRCHHQTRAPRGGAPAGSRRRSRPAAAADRSSPERIPAPRPPALPPGRGRLGAGPLGLALFRGAGRLAHAHRAGSDRAGGHCRAGGAAGNRAAGGGDQRLRPHGADRPRQRLVEPLCPPAAYPPCGRRQRDGGSDRGPGGPERQRQHGPPAPGTAATPAPGAGGGGSHAAAAGSPERGHTGNRGANAAH